MTQVAQSNSFKQPNSTLALVPPSSASYSNHIEVTGKLDDLRDVKISCIDKNGSHYDLSIDNRDKNLIERNLQDVAKVHLSKDINGLSVLSIERSQKFQGEIEITSKNGDVHKLVAIEKRPDIDLTKISNESIEIKVEVPDLKARAVDRMLSPTLYSQYQDFKKLGGEIVVVADKECGFAYQFRRGKQVVATIKPPAERTDFHSNRDKLLSNELANLVREENSSLTYKGKDTSFSRMQSPELYEHTERLSKLGIKIDAISNDNGGLSITLVDKKTGYRGSKPFEIDGKNFVSMARGQNHLSQELSSFLDSVHNRTDLLHRSDGKCTAEFDDRVKELALKIPEKVVDILMTDNWSITTKNHISNMGNLTDNPNQERLPLGRCIPAEKDLQLAEFQTSTQIEGQKASDPNNAIYHEVAHALFYKIQSQDPASWQDTEMNLKMALERDLSQLGDLNAIVDPKDRELSEKLKYYSSLGEGFAESYEGMISSQSNGGRIMPIYFPNFFKACEQLVLSQNLL